MTDPVPVFVPARWASTRFPGKLLQPWGDGTVLGRAVQIARAADLGPVFVLAADERIEQAAAELGVTVWRVDGPHRNGSERVAAALDRLDADPRIVVNLQGDAVGARPDLLAAAVEALRADADAGLATVAVPALRADHRGRTTAREGRPGRAIDFSRAALDPGGGRVGLLLHVGLYAYRVGSLRSLAGAPPTPRETAEGLEQLRWIESGVPVALAVRSGPAGLAHAVDRPADLP